MDQKLRKELKNKETDTTQQLSCTCQLKQRDRGDERTADKSTSEKKTKQTKNKKTLQDYTHPSLSPLTPCSKSTFPHLSHPPTICNNNTVDIEFLVQMRQSDKCGRARGDDIFNLHLGSGAAEIFGKRLFCRPLFLILFSPVFPFTLFLKYFKVIVCQQPQNRSLWISRLVIDLAHHVERNCLTIDCSGTNENGLGRYRMEADNPEKQV